MNDDQPSKRGEDTDSAAFENASESTSSGDETPNSWKPEEGVIGALEGGDEHDLAKVHGDDPASDEESHKTTLVGLGSVELPVPRLPLPTQKARSVPKPGGWNQVNLSSLDLGGFPDSKTEMGIPVEDAEPDEDSVSSVEDEWVAMADGDFDAGATEMIDLAEFEEEVASHHPLPDKAMAADEFEVEKTTVSVPEEAAEGPFSPTASSMQPGLADEAPGLSTEPWTVAPLSDEDVAKPASSSEPVPVQPTIDYAPVVSRQAPYVAAAPAAVEDLSGEDEFDAGKTEMLVNPLREDPQVARLRALSGPVVGQEFFVSGVRNTVGRATNNTIIVPDLGMSRQHFEIARQPDDSYVIRDLQSVNGTWLNGTRVREAELLDGDRIEVGQSAFQVLITGATRPQSARRLVPAAAATYAGEMPQVAKVRSEDTSFQAVMRGVAVVATILCVVVLLILVVLWHRKPGPEPVPESAAEYYLAGVEAMRAREWEQAREYFLVAQSLEPDLTGVSSQLDRISTERQAQVMFERAERQAEEGRWELAARTLSEISRDSSYWHDAQALVREHRKFAVDQYYSEAAKALTDGDPERVEQLLAKIEELVPTHEGARNLREQLEQVKTRQVSEAQPVRSAPSTDRTRPSRPKNAAVRGVNFTEGFALYRARKFDEASRFFQQIATEGDGPVAERAERTSSDISLFVRAYEAANTAFEAGQYAAADRNYAEAMRVDVAVAGRTGYFRAEITARRATVKARLGLEAADQGQFAAAYRFYRDGLEYSSSDSDIRRLRQKLEDEAMRMYVQAVNLSRTDAAEAARLLRTIRSMLPPTSETAQKAQSLLESL